ncbi:hypothetical protein [Rhizobium phage RHph_N46]|nr:hypothetical protein [Rhizobium phage RHph_N46]
MTKPYAPDGCKFPLDCKAELDYGTGVTECFGKGCHVLGFMGEDGKMYNTPPKPKQDEKTP